MNLNWEAVYLDRKLRKKIVFSSLLCLFPMVIGCVFWSVMPENLASHIGLGGVDGLLSKPVIVFVVPALFFALHLVYCFKPDWSISYRLNRYWFMPLVSNLFFVSSFVLSITMTMN
jgi:hypothetical protein